MRKIKNVNVLEAIKSDYQGLTVLPNDNYGSYFVLGSEFNVEVEFVHKCNLHNYIEDHYKKIDFELFSKFIKSFVDSLEIIIEMLGDNNNNDYLYLNINQMYAKNYNTTLFREGINGVIKIIDCKHFIELYSEKEEFEKEQYYKKYFPSIYTEEEFSGFID